MIKRKPGQLWQMLKSDGAFVTYILLRETTTTEVAKSTVWEVMILDGVDAQQMAKWLENIMTSDKLVVDI